jgi:hypothetical protein
MTTELLELEFDPIDRYAARKRCRGERERLQAAARRLEERAFLVRTPEQLLAQYSRRQVAAHEAGHAVVMATYGEIPKYVLVHGDKNRWSGAVSGAPWKLLVEMGAETYLRPAREIVAGWCGERVAGFDVIGSSIHEIVIAQDLTNSAMAISKFVSDRSGYGDDQDTYFIQNVIDPTIAILKRNATIHTRLMRALMRKKRIDGEHLAAVLRGVAPEGAQ